MNRVIATDIQYTKDIQYKKICCLFYGATLK